VIQHQELESPFLLQGSFLPDAVCPLVPFVCRDRSSNAILITHAHRCPMLRPIPKLGRQIPDERNLEQVQWTLDPYYFLYEGCVCTQVGRSLLALVVGKQTYVHKHKRCNCCTLCVFQGYTLVDQESSFEYPIKFCLKEKLQDKAFTTVSGPFQLQVR